MLCGIGLSSHIVAVSSDSGVYDEAPKIIGLTDDDFPKAITQGIDSGKIKPLGKMYNMSAETISSVPTDIVVFTEYGYSPATGEALDKVGTKYIVLANEKSIQTAYDNFDLLGKAFGKQAEASKVVSEMKATIGKICSWCKDIVDNKRSGDKVDAALLISATYAAGSEYIAGTILTDLYANNVFASLGMYGVVSKEAIAEKNPDSIIFTSLGMGDGITDIPAYIDELCNDPIVGDTGAAKNKRMFATSGSAKNSMSYVDQGTVMSYAMCAMFLYKDYLAFSVPSVLDGSNYYDLVVKFWDQVNGKISAVTVTDGIGRTVTIDKTDRITSASATATAMLCGLGLSKNLVAVSSDDGVYGEDPRIVGVADDDFPSAVISGLDSGKIKPLGKMYNMSAETILTVPTDIVVFTEYGYSPATGDALGKMGVKYIVLANEKDITTAYDNFDLLGKAFGKQAEASKVVSEMKSAIGKIQGWCKDIVDNKRGGDRIDTAVMMTATYAVGPEYIAGTIITDLYADNVFSDLGMYGVVSKESIAERNPDAMIYTVLGMGDGVTDIPSYISSLYTDPIIGSTNAAKNKAIYSVSGSARNAMSYVDQGTVMSYAMCAMFLYKDYLAFEIPSELTGDNYYGYVEKFWDAINA